MADPFGWEGDDLAKRVLEATRHGVDATTAACAQHAKSNHEWQNVSGIAEGSIRIEPAEVAGSVVRGQWGSFDVNYFIFLELGTSVMNARPSLQPAAEAEYPKLPERIREALGA